MCGTTKSQRWQTKTWLWNKEVDDAITAKRQGFKALKDDKCRRASYNTAKCISRRAVHHARHEADKVKNDAGKMSMSEEATQNAWAEHYERLLNVEFDWDPDNLSKEPPIEGLPIPIAIDMVDYNNPPWASM